MFVLFDSKTQKIWGVFADRVLLFSTYMVLQEAAANVPLSIKEYKPNTNLTLNTWSTHKSIMKEFSILPSPTSSDTAPDTGAVGPSNVPKAMKSQVDKLFNKYNSFVENFKIFKQMECKTKKDAPQLLQPYFDIFTDLVRLNVPEVEAFGYFMDRITPPTEELAW